MQSLSSAKNSGKIHTRSNSFRWSFSSRPEKKMPKMTRQQLSLVPRAMLDYAVYGWLFFPFYLLCVWRKCWEIDWDSYSELNMLMVRECLHSHEQVIFHLSEQFKWVTGKLAVLNRLTHSLTESVRAVNIWLNQSNWTASHYLWSYLRCT